MTIPWTPLEGSPAARWAAAARLRTVPPMPTRRPPAASPSVSQPALCELGGTWSRSSSSCLRLAGPLGGRKRSLMRTVPSRQDPDSRARRSATRTSCIEPPPEVQHAAVGERRRVDRREVAVAGLLLAAEHADRQPRALARPRQEVLGVVRVADRAGGNGVDRVGVQPARAAEVAEDVERRERTLHRSRSEASAGHQPLADAHGLIDLVGALPPALAGHEDDQPEGVGSEVDDREPLPGLQSAVAGIGRSGLHRTSVLAGAAGPGRSPRGASLKPAGAGRRAWPRTSTGPRR